MKNNRFSCFFSTRIVVCVMFILSVSTIKADNGQFDTYFTTLPKEEGKGVLTTLCYSEEGGENIYLAFYEEPGTIYGMATWGRRNSPWGAVSRMWIECVDAAEELYILAAQGRYLSGIIDNGDGTGVSWASKPGDKAAAMKFKAIENRDAQGIVTGYSFQTADGEWYMTGTDNRLNNLNFLRTTTTDEMGNTVSRKEGGEWKIGDWKGVGFVRLDLLMWNTPSGGGPQPDKDGYYCGTICYPFDVQVPYGNCFSDGTPVPEMTYGDESLSVWTIGNTQEVDGSIKLMQLNSGDIVKAGQVAIIRAKNYMVELLVPAGANYAAMPVTEGMASGYYTQLASDGDFHLCWANGTDSRVLTFARTDIPLRGRHENISYSGYGKEVEYMSDEVILDEFGYSHIWPNIGYIVADDSNAHIQEYRIDFAEGLIKRVGEMGIEVLPSEASPAVYYDLTGRKVVNPTKGIYIISGTKQVVK